MGRGRHWRRTHGESHNTPEWLAWMGMRQRCRDHWRYRVRGITVCERWETYENFLADMGRKPSSAHSLDRIDNSGNYEPGNCRWATWSEQIKNQRRNRIALNVWKKHAGLTEWLT